VQTLLTAGPPVEKDSPDAALYRQLSSLGGPLFRGRAASPRNETTGSAKPPSVSPGNSPPAAGDWGSDPALFGRRPDGNATDPASLCVRAPRAIEFRLPADLVAGCELVTTGILDKESGAEGSVQLEVVAGKAAVGTGLVPSEVKVSVANGPWTSDNRRNSYAAPILVNDTSAARKRIEAALDEFRQLFPAALCYTKIVPVDEVVTLTLFYREDDHLSRLMLDEAQKAAARPALG